MAYVSNALKKGFGKTFKKAKESPASAVMIGGGFGFETVMNMHDGDDLGTSMLKSGFSSALYASNPVLYSGFTLAGLGTDVAYGYQKFKMQKTQWWNSQFDYSNQVGGNYQDTQRAQTMRQAAVQAIQSSKMNARSALGGEAKILNPYSQGRV